MNLDDSPSLAVPPAPLSVAEKPPAPATHLSRAAFFADFYVYPAAAVAFIALALASEPARWLATMVSVLVGILSWTFVEYLLHRYVLHHVKWVKEQHDDHHRDEKALLGTPTWFSMLVFLAFVTMPAVLVGTLETAAGFTAGMMLGYLCYVTAHYGIHHWRIKGGYVRTIRKRHALHHHFDDAGNFGVTNGFWDYVFSTNLAPNGAAGGIWKRQKAGS